MGGQSAALSSCALIMAQTAPVAFRLRASLTVSNARLLPTAGRLAAVLEPAGGVQVLSQGIMTSTALAFKPNRYEFASWFVTIRCGSRCDSTFIFLPMSLAYNDSRAMRPLGMLVAPARAVSYAHLREIG